MENLLTNTPIEAQALQALREGKPAPAVYPDKGTPSSIEANKSDKPEKFVDRVDKVRSAAELKEDERQKSREARRQKRSEDWSKFKKDAGEKVNRFLGWSRQAGADLRKTIDMIPGVAGVAAQIAGEKALQLQWQAEDAHSGTVDNVRRGAANVGMATGGLVRGGLEAVGNTAMGAVGLGVIAAREGYNALDRAVDTGRDVAAAGVDIGRHLLEGVGGMTIAAGRLGVRTAEAGAGMIEIGIRQGANFAERAVVGAVETGVEVVESFVDLGRDMMQGAENMRRRATEGFWKMMDKIEKKFDKKMAEISNGFREAGRDASRDLQNIIRPGMRAIERYHARVRADVIDASIGAGAFVERSAGGVRSFMEGLLSNTTQLEKTAREYQEKQQKLKETEKAVSVVLISA